MVFTVLIIVMVAGIAYYHIAQGFFSATISAVISLLSAVLAVSYHEVLVMSLLKGKVGDYAHAIALIAIFALSYILLRTLFDKAVPGNIRLPVIPDRIGAGLMGFVAGVFAAGVFALAAQSLPFGPTIGYYSRYPVEDAEVRVPPMAGGYKSNQDVEVHDRLTVDKLDPEKASSLYPPVDDILLSVVERLSDGGALAGEHKLSSVHPDYPGELFGQRLGIQTGAKRTALNVGTLNQVRVEDPGARSPNEGVFHPTTDLTKDQVDAEMPEIRGRVATVAPDGRNKYPLVLRVMFDGNAADPEDKYLRLSCASIRLVADGTNFYPVGTLEDGKTLYVNKPDDFLIVNLKDKDRGADLVFFVDESKVLSGDPQAPHIKEGVFLEVKRLAQVDLSGRTVINGVPKPKTADSIQVLRKPVKKKEAEPKPQDQSQTAANVPFVFTEARESNKLFSPINVGTPEANVNNQQMLGGTCSLQEKKFARLDIAPTETLQRMNQGSYTIDDLFEPKGLKLVQVIGTPPLEGGDAWGWASNLNKFTLVDASGKTYTPAGAWAKVNQDTKGIMMIARYDAATKHVDLSGAEGRPTDVWLAFLVPVGTQLKSLKYNAQQVADVTLTAQ